ncbi:uncharacterized protein F5147DRAFT_759714 [Suillus discolor]|uniref:Uncharacterized protein n=1 Tax=Suillus discolor TaxID=1912936 RepID=A0A9P7JW74_9AGAM|nr:uncharacterized protein F5147DRAFT_759714 [Suillus discolor]KAG2111974.1 hypothetical protein F5147DRAFT_759714 [Suillus discolor]
MHLSSVIAVASALIALVSAIPTNIDSTGGCPELCAYKNCCVGQTCKIQGAIGTDLQLNQYAGPQCYQQHIQQWVFTCLGVPVSQFEGGLDVHGPSQASSCREEIIGTVVALATLDDWKRQKFYSPEQHIQHPGLVFVGFIPFGQLVGGVDWHVSTQVQCTCREKIVGTVAALATLEPTRIENHTPMENLIVRLVRLYSEKLYTENMKFVSLARRIKSLISKNLRKGFEPGLGVSWLPSGFGWQPSDIFGVTLHAELLPHVDPQGILHMSMYSLEVQKVGESLSFASVAVEHDDLNIEIHLMPRYAELFRKRPRQIANKERKERQAFLNRKAEKGQGEVVLATFVEQSWSFEGVPNWWFWLLLATDDEGKTWRRFGIAISHEVNTDSIARKRFSIR